MAATPRPKAARATLFSKETAPWLPMIDTVELRAVVAPFKCGLFSASGFSEVLVIYLFFSF